MKTRLLIIIGIVIAGIASGVIIYVLLDQTNYDIPENSKLCTTHILVKTLPGTDRKELSKSVLEEISSLDSRFSLDGRGISVTNMGDDNLLLSIDGLWSHENTGTKLLESIESLESVESILEQDGALLITACEWNEN